MATDPVDPLAVYGMQSGKIPQYASPAQLASLYEYANMLQKASFEPVKHWTQGIGDMVRAVVGGQQGYDADQLIRDYNKSKAAEIMKSYPSGGYTVPTMAPAPGGAPTSPVGSTAPITPTPVKTIPFPPRTSLPPPTNPNERVSQGFGAVNDAITSGGFDPNYNMKNVSPGILNYIQGLMGTGRIPTG